MSLRYVQVHWALQQEEEQVHYWCVGNTNKKQWVERQQVELVGVQHLMVVSPCVYWCFNVWVTGLTPLVALHTLQHCPLRSLSEDTAGSKKLAISKGQWTVQSFVNVFVKWKHPSYKRDGQCRMYCSVLAFSMWCSSVKSDTLACNKIWCPLWPTLPVVHLVSYDTDAC